MLASKLHRRVTANFCLIDTCHTLMDSFPSFQEPIIDN